MICMFLASFIWNRTQKAKVCSFKKFNSLYYPQTDKVKQFSSSFFRLIFLNTKKILSKFVLWSGHYRKIFVFQEQKQALEGHLKERTEFLEEAAKEKYVICIFSFLFIYGSDHFLNAKKTKNSQLIADRKKRNLRSHFHGDGEERGCHWESHPWAICSDSERRRRGVLSLQAQARIPLSPPGY